MKATPADDGGDAVAVRHFPAPMAPEAYHGPAGDLVRLIAPHTEADPVAVLVQTLCLFGNLIGRGPHFVAEADRHYTNLFLTLVGLTSHGRKGTSYGQAKAPFLTLDAEWAVDRVQGGLSSGEGLIHHVRDKQDKLADAGVADKRLLCYEPEFASILKQATREGNVLSPIIRQAWDTGALQVMTKTSPTKATAAHVSIIGHVTKAELLRNLSETESANGFANRFLWFCTRRSKELPEGGRIQEEDFGPVIDRFRAAVTFARTLGEAPLRRDREACALWARRYSQLSSGRPGLLGAVLSRAEAQTMRLALVYALLDCSTDIKLAHLQAALAVWDYSERSVAFIFGDALGDPVADEVLRLLRQEPAGLTRTEIRDAFGRHRSGLIDQALARLSEMGAVRVTKEVTGGRPAGRWMAVQCDRSDISDRSPRPEPLPSLPSLLSHPNTGAEVTVAPGDPDPAPGVYHHGGGDTAVVPGVGAAPSPPSSPPEAAPEAAAQGDRATATSLPPGAGSPAPRPKMPQVSPDAALLLARAVAQWQ